MLIGAKRGDDLRRCASGLNGFCQVGNVRVI